MKENSNLGTVTAPRYYEGPTWVKDDVHIRIRYFTYWTDEGLVAGRNNSDMFIIDHPAKDIWPYFKDFNLWQGGYGFSYPGVVGDLEGQVFHLGARLKAQDLDFSVDPKKDWIRHTRNAKPDPDAPLVESPYKYKVLKVEPEHLIILSQPAPEDGSNGGISGGFHMFTLNEHQGKTWVTIYTQHATRTKDRNAEEMLAPFREGADELMSKFRDNFIPNLKRLVREGNSR